MSSVIHTTLHTTDDAHDRSQQAARAILERELRVTVFYRNHSTISDALIDWPIERYLTQAERWPVLGTDARVKPTERSSIRAATCTSRCCAISRATRVPTGAAATRCFIGSSSTNMRTTSVNKRADTSKTSPRARLRPMSDARVGARYSMQARARRRSGGSSVRRRMVHASITNRWWPSLPSLDMRPTCETTSRI